MILKKKIIIFILFIVFISSCAVEQEQKTLTPVKVQLKWLHQAQFAGMYVANDKGFYKEQGIEISELLPFDFVNFPIDSVENKKVDFGITGADELIIAKSQGKADHVKAIAVIYKINPVCLYTLEESGINEPDDLIGKTVGIERAADGTDINVGILYYSMLNNLNIDKNEINEVTIGYDATELLNGDVDVSSGYIINEPDFVTQNGKKVNIILTADYGVNMYGDVIIVHEDTINNNPELVENFLRATLQGWQYAVEHEDESLDITLNYAKDSNKEHQKYMLESSIPLIHTGDSQVGMMEEKEWEGAQRILFDQEFIKKPIGPENIYTLEFLNKIYNINNEKNKVPVKLAWLHQNQFAGFYTADQLGYYDNFDINIELDSAGYGLPIDQSVVSGNDLFGVMDSHEFIKSVSKGNKLKAVAVVFTKDPVVFISLKEKNITTSADLKDKTIAFSLYTPERVILSLKKNDIESSDVTFVQKEYGVKSLYDKNVDVLAGVVFNEVNEALSQGLDINVMSAEELGIDSYYNVIFTTQELIDTNPELVENFVKATLQGWKYVIENPKQSSNFVFNYDTGLSTYSQDEMLTSILNYINPIPIESMGIMSKEKWQKTYDELYSIGELDNTINVEDIFTNEFVE